MRDCWPWRLMLKEGDLPQQAPNWTCLLATVNTVSLGGSCTPFFVLFAVGLESRDLMPAGQVLKDSPHPPS